MVSAYTPNIQLEEPARGDQVGTWDTPVNNNMTLIDLIVGGRVSIALNNSPVVLAAAQYQCKTITFSSTLTGSVAITFPSTFTKSYEVYNTCTGSSAFVITLQTTAAGGQAICCPPGEIVECINDGTNLRFKNFGRVGSFWDYGGSSVPAWVTGCTVPPYLNCDATAFSSTTYPILTLVLGGTTLPDSKGSVRATLNQATGRLTSSQGGVDGNTNLARGGGQTATLGSSHIPTLTSSGTVTVQSNRTGIPYNTSGGNFDGGSVFPIPYSPSGFVSASPLQSSGTVSVTFSNSSQGAVATVPPTYIGGLTLIRAA